MAGADGADGDKAGADGASPGAAPWALHDVTFTARKGQTVAIMGPTGSGKTTLVQLIAALYDYQSGSIKIDGVELKAIDKAWLRRHVGIVEQEPFLFSTTVEGNIAAARPGAAGDELRASARAAQIHDVILGFPDGYGTMVGERGVTLSGGQKQRVAIARTLLGGYPILIFDDSLSSVDTETDAAIRAALKARAKGETTFLIAHRAATLADADLILVLEGGRVTQAGTHAQLVAQDGLYRRVWELQSAPGDAGGEGGAPGGAAVDAPAGAGGGAVGKGVA
jgi:ATP-binding cassette subfamily B protein